MEGAPLAGNEGEPRGKHEELLLLEFPVVPLVDGIAVG
jgi:hypothetical protein